MDQQLFNCLVGSLSPQLEVRSAAEEGLKQLMTSQGELAPEDTGRSWCRAEQNSTRDAVVVENRCWIEFITLDVDSRCGFVYSSDEYYLYASCISCSLSLPSIRGPLLLGRCPTPEIHQTILERCLQ